MEKMKANVFYGKDDIRVEEVEKPRAGAQSNPGLVIGPEPVGVIEEFETTQRA